MFKILRLEEIACEPRKNRVKNIEMCQFRSILGRCNVNKFTMIFK